MNITALVAPTMTIRFGCPGERAEFAGSGEPKLFKSVLTGNS
jgi:hypothetical protein